MCISYTVGNRVLLCGAGGYFLVVVGLCAGDGGKIRVITAEKFARLPHPEGWHTRLGSGFAMTLILYFFSVLWGKLLTAPQVEELRRKVR
jgi:hypothetical protein